MNVSAVLVTRGNVDLAPVLETLPYDDIVVWDNSVREDLGLYGRYAAIEEAKHDVIYTQDDDLLFTRHAELASAYESHRLVVNMPNSHDIPWPSRGSLFHRELPEMVFAEYLEHFDMDQWFTHYGCDGVFCLLANTRAVDLGHQNLPYAFDEGRISTSPGWYDDKRLLIQERVNKIKENSHETLVA